MIYLILFCVLVFVAVFIAMLWKTVVIKDKMTKKIKLNFSTVKKGLVSKFIWAIIGAIAIIYAISLLLPIIWMLMTSVKGELEFERNNFGFPTEWHFENYWIVLQRFEIRQGVRTYGIPEMLLNSIIYACGNPLVTIFWIFVVAYAMARFTWFGNKFLYSLGVFLMTVTIAGSSASQMIIFQKIGLYDNLYLNVIMPPATAFSGMYFMIIHGACKGISQAYSEAAYIDGAGEYRVMFTIIMPMILPTLCTIYVLTFLTLWNQYESFLVWYPSYPNLAYGLYMFQHVGQSGSGGLSMPQILTGITIIMIPSLILYLATQKILRSNFVVGGLKG